MLAITVATWCVGVAGAAVEVVAEEGGGGGGAGD